MNESFKNFLFGHFKNTGKAGTTLSLDHLLLIWKSITLLKPFLLCVCVCLIEVQLIYNVVFITAIQQSDSVIHIHLFFFMVFSTIVFHRILNVVPCAL